MLSSNFLFPINGFLAKLFLPTIFFYSTLRINELSYVSLFVYHTYTIQLFVCHAHSLNGTTSANLKKKTRLLFIKNNLIKILFLSNKKISLEKKLICVFFSTCIFFNKYLLKLTQCHSTEISK